MRNLTIAETQAAQLPAGCYLIGNTVASFCVDVMDRQTYTIVGDNTNDSVFLYSIKLAGAENIVTRLCSLPFPATGAEIVGMRFMMERESVFLALRSGDIYTIQAADGSVDLVGTVDSGIWACQWSPDDEVLALVTGEAKLLLMTQDFDVLEEQPLACGEQGEEVQVSLGWGKKETQYHGKAGKEAALAVVPEVKSQLSPDDDGQMRISWRGDADYFSVSFITQDMARQIRVFSREGKFHSIAEKIKMLEHTLGWRPSGRLVTSTEKLEHRHDVVFFERNGLRHGEFTLRKQTKKVLDLNWNSDSSILAVTALVDTGKTEPEVCVELWTEKNYHWYLKQQLRFSSLFEDDVLKCVVWDTEDPMRLYMAGSTTCSMVRLHSKPDVAHVASARSNMASCVIDGHRLLYTPLGYANVPPPMALYTLEQPAPMSHVVFGGFGEGNDFAVLLADQKTVVLYECAYATNMSESKPPVEKGRIHMGDTVKIQQITWPDQHTLVGLGVSCIDNQRLKQALVRVDIRDGFTTTTSIELPTTMTGLYTTSNADKKLLVAGSDGSVYTVSESVLSPTPLTKLPEACMEIDAITIDSGDTVVIGLTERNQLFANQHLLSSVCSSFYLRQDFLVFTTTTHFVRFVPVDSDLLTVSIKEGAADTAVSKYDETQRRVERGSTIVVASPVGDMVVFQMPRGNLETVRPRALVLTTVRQYLDERRYRDALLACRVNRIDMNLIYDHVGAKFVDDLAEFVAQINEPDLLNLFVSGLRDENVTKTMYTGAKQQQDAVEIDTKGKTNSICRSLRSALKETEDSKYMPTILTTFMCEEPANIPSALQLLAPLSTDERDSALTYLLFLSDVDTVYNAALGLYDLPLALLVAQQSQRDPREYLMALGELNAIESEAYRKYKMDAQLERTEKAVQNLHAAYIEAEDKEPEPALWDELAEYVDANDLYRFAIGLLSGHHRFSDMCVLCGDSQSAKKEWTQAGASYLLGGSLAKAINSFVMGKEWRTAMSLACSPDSGCTAQAVHDTAVKASEILTDHHLFLDAATVLLEYTENDEDAIELLVRGSHWAEAIRSALTRNRQDLVETTIQPGLMDSYGSLVEDIDEISEAFTSKLSRLKEVRSKPLEILVDENTMAGSDNIDVMSDTASMASQFTTFTGTVTNATSRMTGSTARRISKNKKKEQKRKARGKKGSIYEESYLVDSLSKLIDRVRVHQTAVRDMNWALIRFGKLSVANGLQSKFEVLVRQVLDNANPIFDEQRVQMRMGENGVPEPVPPEVNQFGVSSEPNHPKPVLPSLKWKVDALTS